MTTRKQTHQVRVRRLGILHRRETLGDLNGQSNANLYSALRTDLRDGAVSQRCGGGSRLIRKRTPE